MLLQDQLWKISSFTTMLRRWKLMKEKLITILFRTRNKNVINIFPVLTSKFNRFKRTNLWLLITTFKIISVTIFYTRFILNTWLTSKIFYLGVDFPNISKSYSLWEWFFIETKNIQSSITKCYTLILTFFHTYTFTHSHCSIPFIRK